jgi:hypothetical protein
VAGETREQELCSKSKGNKAKDNRLLLFHHHQLLSARNHHWSSCRWTVMMCVVFHETEKRKQEADSLLALLAWLYASSRSWVDGLILVVAGRRSLAIAEGWLGSMVTCSTVDSHFDIFPAKIQFIMCSHFQPQALDGNCIYCYLIHLGLFKELDPINLKLYVYQFPPQLCLLQWSVWSFDFWQKVVAKRIVLVLSLPSLVVVSVINLHSPLLPSHTSDSLVSE